MSTATSLAQINNETIDHRFAVAPMLDWTDRHCRFFLRLLSKHTVLYTEMVTTGAILYGKGDYLCFDKAEHPVVLQLGGSDPVAMTKCAIIAQEKSFDEVNINVGCPSDRVKNGSFGACLMASPSVVATCVRNMQAAVNIPVTVKCRIGIDDMEERQGLFSFVDTVAAAGCKHFIVHARKAWLKGLSPKQNRDIPPLNYPLVYELKQKFPELQISLNGGINSLEETKRHLCHVNGVMMGREVYSNPYILAEIDNAIFNAAKTEIISRDRVVGEMQRYVERQLEQGARVWHVARHMLGLFQGQVGGKIWRRYLTQNCPKRNHDHRIISEAHEQVLAAQENALKLKKSRQNVWSN